MHTNKLLPALLEAMPVLILTGALVLSVCLGLYMLGVNLYSFIKPNKRFSPSRPRLNTLYRLKLAYIFFLLTGMVGVSLGSYDWLSQPSDRTQALRTVLSGIFFFGLARVTYKETKKY